MKEESFFLAKNMIEPDDRDAFMYVWAPEYDDRTKSFSRINTHGPCYCGVYNFQEVEYKNVQTHLTQSEWLRLQELDRLLGELKRNIERGSTEHEAGQLIAKEIKEILHGAEDRQELEDIKDEEREYIMELYGFDNDDMDKVYDDAPNDGDYFDRGLIGYVYDDKIDYAENEATSLGLPRHLEEFIDYEKYGDSLLESEDVIELADGRVVTINQ